MRDVASDHLGVAVSRAVVTVPAYFNDRQRQVINRMLDEFKGYLTTSKYAKLAKCSTDSALRDIKDLLDRAILIKNPSGGRSTSYALNPEIPLDMG